MKTTPKSTLMNMKTLLLALIVSSSLYNCQSESEDSDIIEEEQEQVSLCENATIVGLNISNPFHGDAPVYASTGLGDYGTQILQLFGGPISYSNASTYNPNLDSYHYLSSNIITTIIDNETTRIYVTGSAADSELVTQHSHLVYVSGTDKYYTLEHMNNGIINLVEINIETGEISDSMVPLPFPINPINALSITTNNNDLVFISINDLLVTFNVESMALVAERLIGNNFGVYNFAGLEYNSELDAFNAIRIGDTNETDLVTINLDASYEVLYSLSSDTHIEDNSSIKEHFYSTTLNCDNSTYIISYLRSEGQSGYNHSLIKEVNLATGDITSSFKDGRHTYGLEVDTNN